ncbi:Hsp20/alpha crystallin family protein [Nesterenkonia ebinurensis]|uniref:Hsp20/alpha crystallin family protein n=1 Tax=Nesterenkonia ebinurensis TaxID=2608252 RepID=UPI00123DF96D|nr:Hsp20/alpha crystallin family protein [Nesterenkonia ebinurensis]
MTNTTLTRLDPFSVFDDMVRLIRSPLAQEVQRNSRFVPAVDAHRDGENLVLQADLPGIDPENDISVELTGRTLTISGERRSQNEAEGLREVRYGSFSRTVTLPADVDEGSITAEYTHGVLKVVVPGVYAEEKPHRIRILSSTGETTQVSGQDEKKEINA